MHPVLEGSNSNFSNYVFWFESVQGYLLERSGADTPLFPCVLPYPEVLLTEGAFLDAPQVVDWWTKAFVNTFVAWGNFITLGCPSERGSGYEPRVGYRCLADARAFADKLLGEVEEFVCLELALGRLGCDGKRGCIEHLLGQVHCTGAACYAGFAQVKGKVSTALPVVAERVAMPEQAGKVDPCEWLPPDRAEVVRHLDRLRKPEEMWEEVVASCHRVPPEEEDALARKLVAHNMAIPVREDLLPRDRDGRLLVGGLFSVAKNELEDRLIFDRRPENATMERLEWARLPSGACFTRMMLEEDEYLRGSGDDLRNYYYTPRLPEDWIKHNAVGRRLSQSLSKELGLPEGVHHRLCFRVLGMGDVNGCDIAQAVHEAVLQKRGVLSEGSALIYGTPVPRGPSWEGVYIDDLLICQKCRVSDVIPQDGSFVAPPPQEDDVDVQKVAQAEIAYEQAGLLRAVHKAFRFETRFKAWGAEIDGIKGQVGTPLTVRRQLWMLLHKIVATGWCCQEVLRKMLGYLSYVFQYRRELYCLQHHVYRFISSMPPEGWVRLPAYILDELRSYALHLPFSFWNMRNTVNPTLIATDATPTTGGSVSTRMPASLAEELWRLSEMKGEAVRLDGDCIEELCMEEPREPSLVASIVGKSMHWKVTGSYTFRQTSHVNLQELRALRRELVRMAAAGEHQGTVVVALNDSRVVVGAVSKGRSSSFKLNGMLRGLLPHLILGGVSVALLWIETAANPADYPSRGLSLPPPRRAPGWLRKLGVARNCIIKGLEVFAGVAGITKAHLEAGFDMGPPVDVLYGLDARSAWIDEQIEAGLLYWLWLAPPCSSFSALRNLDAGGPLRPKDHPAGNESVPEVALGNALWRRALQLAWKILNAGGYFFLEHPRGSMAWALAETQQLMSHQAVYMITLDFCAHTGIEGVHGTQKPTRLLTNAPWGRGLGKRCPGNHHHPPALRGARAKAAGAYPPSFCAQLANAFACWAATQC